MLVGNEYVNIALGATVTPIGGTSTNIDRVTNGNMDTENCYDGGTGRSGVLVDLGANYYVDRIVVWHYYGDGRQYKKEQLSFGTTLVSGLDPLANILINNSGNGLIETPDGIWRKWLQFGQVVNGGSV